MNTVADIPINVTLYNAQNTVDLTNVIEPLFDIPYFHFCIEQKYFSLQYAALVEELRSHVVPGSIAVLVVHANENRLSINELDAGIGYSQLYQAMLYNTGGCVLVVIAHDSKTHYRSQGPLVADWIQNMIGYQFSSDQSDGTHGFLMSWDKRPMTVHQQALFRSCETLKGEKHPHQLDQVKPLLSNLNSPTFKAAKDAYMQETPLPIRGSHVKRHLTDLHTLLTHTGPIHGIVCAAVQGMQWWEEKKKREQEIREKPARIEHSINKLANYQPESMDVLDISKLRIAVFGHQGSGKSTFINTVERVLTKKDCGSCSVQSKGGEGGCLVQDVAFGPFCAFNLVDTKGFMSYDATEIEEFVLIMEGHFRDGERIDRNAPQLNASKAVPLSAQIHGCIFVVNAADPRLKTDIQVNDMNLLRKYLKGKGITVVTVVVCESQVQPKEKQNVLEAASRATGSPANQTLFVSTYIRDGCARNSQTEEQVVQVLEYALAAAERYVKIAKQRQAYKNEHDTSVSSHTPQSTSASQQPQSMEAPPHTQSVTPQQTNSQHSGSTASKMNNLEITIESTLSYNKKKRVIFTTTVNSTCGELLAQIKRLFKLGNLDDYYFSDAIEDGRVFSGPSIVSEAHSNTLYLRSYDE